MNLVIVIIRVHQSLHIRNYNVSEVRNCVILDFSSFAFEMHYIVTVTPCFPLENSDVRHSELLRYLHLLILWCQREGVELLIRHQ